MQEQQLFYLHSLSLQAYQNLNFEVYIKNKNSQYLWANDFFLKKSAGVQSVNDIYHKNDTQFVWEPYADELRANDVLVVEQASSLSVREQVLRYEGTYINIISNKLPLFNEKQQIIGLLGFSLELPKMSVQTPLSKREHACLLLLSEGLTYKEIAKKLKISSRTVEFHVTNAKKKWGTSSCTKLISQFIRPNSRLKPPPFRRVAFS